MSETNLGKKQMEKVNKVAHGLLEISDVRFHSQKNKNNLTLDPL